MLQGTNVYVGSLDIIAGNGACGSDEWTTSPWYANSTGVAGTLDLCPASGSSGGYGGSNYHYGYWYNDTDAGYNIS